ncbi:hypothetical protein OHB26_08865 [Nocardia sp. NBC_01503]|uniref:hypothetical protein n=1 Tax=Nocardia sp. NBC_01503 TaxID=2975997 RepID=UPI002E7B19E6|nr:hypothetical protein [Nocardia sp. NBC_01503]WTL34293.1 hypothetical protein OHB26_08865 [Nocardia sp. NBC_01503]
MRQHTVIAPGIVRLRPTGDLGSDVQQLLRRVRTEAVVAVSSPMRLENHYALGHLAVRELMGTGKRIRLLYSPDFLDSRDRRPLLEDSTLGPKIRVSSHDFQNTFIIDRHAAVLWSGAGAKHPYMVMVRDPALIGAIHQFATMTWESAARLASRPGFGRAEFDERDLAVLDALNSGLKDEVAARRLEVSLRTYRRYVAELMVRLEVSTRFQVGVRAAQLGLIG